VVLMRHHTATHILLHAAKEVLGAHVHQAGAQKGPESSRLDIRHYKHTTPEELHKIEIAANRMVMADLPVDVTYLDRTRAEQMYGFSLYQGGVPPGREIRVVRVAGDVEACAGTHCRSTGDVGFIKIMRVEHIQDGIERLEFAAGLAAVEYVHRIENILSESAGILSVQVENLPATVSRFFSEWKSQKKEIERLRQRIAELERKSLNAEVVGRTPVLVRRIDLSGKELAEIGSEIAARGGVALLAGGSDQATVLLVSGSDRVDASEIIGDVCAVLGGKGGGSPSLARGGGPAVEKIDAALAAGREKILAALGS